MNKVFLKKKEGNKERKEERNKGRKKVKEVLIDILEAT